MSGVRRCSGNPKALFTRREGYPGKRVNPSKRITLASGLTLAEGQKIARVYKQNFTGRVALQPGTT